VRCYEILTALPSTVKQSDRQPSTDKKNNMIPREENKERKGGSTFQKWLPVLALVILGGFFISIFLSGKGYSNAAIVAHYFIPPFIKTVPANIDDVYKTASTDLDFLEHQYLIGNLSKNNNDFTKSIEAYETVLNNEGNSSYETSNIDFHAARWNQVLMIMSMGDRTKAIEEFEKIIASDLPDEYKSDAKILIGKMNSFWYGWAN